MDIMLDTKADIHIDMIEIDRCTDRLMECLNIGRLMVRFANRQLDHGILKGEVSLYH
jgi:hypothetical protein